MILRKQITGVKMTVTPGPPPGYPAAYITDIRTKKVRKVIMKKARIINLIGWVFIIFLTIGVIFFSEQFSWVTTSIWGLICNLIGLFLIFYKFKPRK
jgi:hypothetical protein